MSDLHTELLDSLNELPRTENYSAKDRYADFRQLFMGSDQGKRVYRELLSWGMIFNAGSSTDTNKVMMEKGNRNFALKLMSAVTIDPPEKPTRATSRRTITNPIK